MSVTEAPRRIPRWLWWVVGGVILSTVVCVLVAGIVAWQFMNSTSASVFGEPLVDKLPPEKVALATGLTLPPSTSNVHSHYEAFQDYMIHARFEIAAADLDALLASAQLAEPLSSTVMPAKFTETFDQPWWQPQSVSSFLAGDGSVSLPSGYPDYRGILVDTSDSERYIVYVVAFDS